MRIKCIWRNEKRMNFRNKALLSVSLIALISSAGYASLLLYKDVQTNMRIEALPALDIFNVDHATPLTSIALGDFVWDKGKSFPGGSEYVPGDLVPVPSQTFFANNSDQKTLYISFQVIGAPSQVYYFIYMRRCDQPAYVLLNPGDIYQFPLVTQYENNDLRVQTAQWYLAVWVYHGAPFGTFSATIQFNAFDTPSG